MTLHCKYPAPCSFPHSTGMSWQCITFRVFSFPPFFLCFIIGVDHGACNVSQTVSMCLAGFLTCVSTLVLYQWFSLFSFFPCQFSCQEFARRGQICICNHVQHARITQREQHCLSSGIFNVPKVKFQRSQLHEFCFLLKS